MFENPGNDQFSLETSASIFKRGLPLNGDLRLPSVARIFFSVLSTGVVTDAEITTEDDKKALSLCFRNGWLHTGTFYRRRSIAGT
jgi:hypothetical protein